VGGAPPPPDAQRLGEVVANVERHLRRDPDRVRAVGRGDDGDPVRLHRGGRHPLVHEPRTDDDLRSFQGIIRTLGPERVRDVGSELGPEQRRPVGRRRLQVHHGRQRLVLDGDQLGRIDGLRKGLPDHDTDDLANEPDHVARQRLAAERSLELPLGGTLHGAGWWER